MKRTKFESWPPNKLSDKLGGSSWVRAKANKRTLIRSRAATKI